MFLELKRAEIRRMMFLFDHTPYTLRVVLLVDLRPMQLDSSSPGALVTWEAQASIGAPSCHRIPGRNDFATNEWQCQKDCKSCED